MDYSGCTCGSLSPFHAIGCDRSRALLASHGVAVTVVGLSPAETLIYERQPGNACTCAAYRSAGLAAACSRCTPPTIAEAQRAAWEAAKRWGDEANADKGPAKPTIGLDAMLPQLVSGRRDCRDRNAATGRTDECGTCRTSTVAATLGDALMLLATLRRIADSLNIHDAVNHIDMATFAVERELKARRGTS